MAGDSFRDRFFTRKVSRAITAPGSILTFGAATAVGIVATAPLSLPALGILGVGALFGSAAYGAKVLFAMPPKAKGQQIDPFGVNEPWRRFVAEALQARARFEQSIATMKAGPLRETLDDIGDRLQDAVDECWRVARRGQAVADARSLINVEGTRYELGQMQERASEPWAAGSTLARTVEALEAQVASAERMDRLLVDTVDRLRLLDARMDETVTRAIELAVQADSPDDLGGLGADVEGLVLDMEALRQALDETASGGHSKPDMSSWNPSAPPQPTTSPDTGSPDTGNPDTGNPDTGNPDTGNPDTGNPDTGNPDTGSPDTDSPDTDSPDTGSPDGEGRTEPPTASGAS
jgi:hypothetical protein